jgi:hypothetical protein
MVKLYGWFHKTEQQFPYRGQKKINDASQQNLILLGKKNHARLGKKNQIPVKKDYLKG